MNKSITDFPWKYEIEIKSIWVIKSFLFTLILYILCFFWKMKFCHEIFISLSCPNYICATLKYTNYHNNKWQQTSIVYCIPISLVVSKQSFFFSLAFDVANSAGVKLVHHFIISLQGKSFKNHENAKDFFTEFLTGMRSCYAYINILDSIFIYT